MVEPYFDPQTVVSLDQTGQHLSRYGDRSWNLSSMSSDGGQTQCNLYFFDAQPLPFPSQLGGHDLAALVREQQKALMWLHIDTGRQRAQSTTLNTNNTLGRLAQSAYRCGVTLFELFCDPQLLGEESAELNQSYANSARSLLRTVWRHRDFLRIGHEVRIKELGDAIKNSGARQNNEGMEVGKPWPLTFHQYRRSLSVYAHRSGMVSLPALKGQLQHITDEMRAYYSDGFCRAVNLVFDKGHFSHEWRAAKAESSFLAYALGILFSDEELLGQGAERMANTVVSRPRSETLKLFKDGKLAYKATVLGGCVSTEECKVQPLEVIPIECLEKNCVNLVVSPQRLGLVIQSQEVVVAILERDERGSVEHRLEVGSLQVLLKARQRLTETG